LKKENISIEDILRVISDNKALVLFNTIALTEGAPIQIRKIGLTTRQYYSRLSRLTKTGLVTRKNGRYFLTLLGKIVYEIHMSACKVLSYHWKLKILESIQMSAPKLPEEEFSMKVDTLIDDYRIKNMVIRALASMDSYEEYFRQQKEKEQEIEGELKAL
jgi:DNA-binding HxlR family transcriptional regulator